MDNIINNTTMINDLVEIIDKRTLTNSQRNTLLTLLNVIDKKNTRFKFKGENLPKDTEELWKDIKGYEGLYQVSTYGRVKSLEHTTNDRYFKEKLYKPTEKSGHFTVVLRKHGTKPKHFALSRLILTTFVGECPKGCIACHKDGNSRNNHVDNLYWGTYAQNTRDLFVSNTAKQARLTVEQVKEIKRATCNGYKRGTLQKLEKQYNVGKCTIWNIVAGRTWKWIKV